MSFDQKSVHSSDQKFIRKEIQKNNYNKTYNDIEQHYSRTTEFNEISSRFYLKWTSKSNLSRFSLVEALTSTRYASVKRSKLEIKRPRNPINRPVDTSRRNKSSLPTDNLIKNQR